MNLISPWKFGLIREKFLIPITFTSVSNYGLWQTWQNLCKLQELNCSWRSVLINFEMPVFTAGHLCVFSSFICEDLGNCTHIKMEKWVSIFKKIKVQVTSWRMTWTHLFPSTHTWKLKHVAGVYHKQIILELQCPVSENSLIQIWCRVASFRKQNTALPVKLEF